MIWTQAQNAVSPIETSLSPRSRSPISRFLQFINAEFPIFSTSLSNSENVRFFESSEQIKLVNEKFGKASAPISVIPSGIPIVSTLPNALNALAGILSPLRTDIFFNESGTLKFT